MPTLDDAFDEVRYKFLEDLARSIDEARNAIDKVDASTDAERARKEKEKADLNDMLEWARNPNRPKLPPIGEPGGPGSNVGRREDTRGIGQPR